ncbi:MAG: histidine phosphatase family protein [Microthrixaceae bacterium]
MSELVVVRHGRTKANATGLLLGRLDVPLDPIGEAQAAALAAAVHAHVERSGGTIAAVVSSPLLRTRQTAAAFGFDVQIDDRLIELDYGDLDGTPIADVPVEVWAAWRSDATFRPPGCAESLADVQGRVEAACVDWSQRVDGAIDGAIDGAALAGDTVVLVTHVSPLKAAVGWALGIGDGAAWSTHVDPASITRIGVGGGRRVLRTFNETAHLA